MNIVQKSVVAGLVAAGAIGLASPSLMEFLGRWEGDGQNAVYADQLAGGLPTVCKGITRHTSPYPVVVGDYWSDERCEEVEQMVVKDSQLRLADCLNNPNIRQPTFDALSSHAHNFGVANTCASRAVGLINSGQVADGCRALAWSPAGNPVWAYVTTANGAKQFIRGLHNRRLAEVELCLEGLRNDSSPIKCDRGPVAGSGSALVADRSAGRDDFHGFQPARHGDSASGWSAQYLETAA